MFIARMIGEKRRYWQYKARIKRLPPEYGTAIEAIERYMTYSGSIVNGEVIVVMLEDLADLFEQSAADAIPVRDIVGDDPVEFADTFLKNYADGQWIDRERKRLVDAIDRAAGDQSHLHPQDGDGHP
ncbi:MAG: DUF1048 domain-containing protein [Thermomicrobiales bacterium]